MAATGVILFGFVLGHMAGNLQFFLGREKIVARRRSGLTLPFKKLFILLSNVALDATEFFRIPVNRIVELGGQSEL